MQATDPVFVAGGETTIGRAILRALERGGFRNVLAPKRAELPLGDGRAVDAWMEANRPTVVIVAAGKSGGIGLNRRRPAELMLDNLLVATSVLGAAARHGVERLLYLASSCCYPKECPQPMRPEHLESGPLEPTSAAYATAKLAGIRLCQALRTERSLQFVAGIPADVFGPDSSFDPEESHVIPALIARFHAAKLESLPEVSLWGSGNPRREFLFADDLGDACIAAIRGYNQEVPINLGGGAELSIREVAGMIAEVVGYQGRLAYDTSRPDGMPRKLLDSSVLMGLGWRPATPFRDALEATYRGFLATDGSRVG
ncbi:MAG: GDP-L-fucose synthase family protein [Planctomycetaceae bacterium]